MIHFPGNFCNLSKNLLLSIVLPSQPPCAYQFYPQIPMSYHNFFLKTQAVKIFLQNHTRYSKNQVILRKKFHDQNLEKKRGNDFLDYFCLR